MRKAKLSTIRHCRQPGLGGRGALQHNIEAVLGRREISDFPNAEKLGVMKKNKLAIPLKEACCR